MKIPASKFGFGLYRERPVGACLILAADSFEHMSKVQESFWELRLLIQCLTIEHCCLLVLTQFVRKQRAVVKDFRGLLAKVLQAQVMI